MNYKNESKKEKKKTKEKKSMIINTEKCIFSYAVHSSSRMYCINV